MLTDDLISKFISEEKVITELPRKDFREESQHFRNDFQLTSSDGTRKYSVFMRKHITFLENFSIGLIYHSEEGTSINLFRCNGNHGEVVIDILNPIPHFGYHTHKNDPKQSELTQEYASFEQALNYFCRYVNIKDANKFFPNINQTNMFE